MPASDHFPAAVWSDRLGDWTIVHLKTETTIDEGSFVLTPDVRRGPDGEYLPIAEYHPGRDGTHTPLGPNELEAAGLRHVPTRTERTHES
jgi:hypothetical protein